MKILAFILFFSPIVCMAQVDRSIVKLSAGVQDSVLGTSLILKENALIFQKVYNTEYSKEELVSRLRTYLPSVKDFQLTDMFNQTSDQFSGKLSGFIVNYRKFGGTSLGTSTLLNFPLKANVIVQVKDRKYRVIISEIVFQGVRSLPYDPANDRAFDDIISRKKRTQVRTSDQHLKTAKYLNDDLDASFDLKSNNKVSNDF